MPQPKQHRPTTTYKQAKASKPVKPPPIDPSQKSLQETYFVTTNSNPPEELRATTQIAIIPAGDHIANNIKTMRKAARRGEPINTDNWRVIGVAYDMAEAERIRHAFNHTLAAELKEAHAAKEPQP